MNMLRRAWVVFAKELRVEFRTHELTLTTGFFVLLVAGMFSFAFEPTSTEARALVPGLLWLAFLFAASLMLQFSFLREQIDDTLSALRLAAGDPFAILLGKAAASGAFLFGIELVFLPVFAVFYNLPLHLLSGALLGMLLAATAGLSLVGSAFSALVARSRMRELLLPLLLLPLLSPVLIAGVEATAEMFDTGSADARWWGIVGAFDVTYLAAAWLLADFLIQE